MYKYIHIYIYILYTCACVCLIQFLHKRVLQSKKVQFHMEIHSHSHQWFMSETSVDLHAITYVNAAWLIKPHCKQQEIHSKEEANHHLRRDGCFSSDHSSTGSDVSYHVFGCVVLQQFRYQGRNPLDNRILRWHLLALDPQTWMNEPNWDHNTAAPSRSQAK